MFDRHGPGALFDDPNWKRLRAPVVPPAWVIKELGETHQPVLWENGENREGDETIIGNNKNWLMFYRTEFEGNRVVTRLLPGSAQPIKDWLYYSAK